MADTPITLEFLARQQQRVIEEIGVMRDDMQVLTAMVMRLDGTVGLVLTELRATRGQAQELDVCEISRFAVPAQAGIHFGRG